MTTSNTSAASRCIKRPVTTEKKLTILVVDDDEALLKVASRVMRLYGYNVLSAGSCREALDITRALDEPIDLLLTDVLMPGEDGCALAEQLTNEHPVLRVLYTSGYPSTVLSPSAYSVGGPPQFIDKPFAAADLARRVSEVLGATPPAH